MTRFLKMLETSRNPSCFVHTIEYVILANVSEITFNSVLQSIIEVLQIQLNTCFSVNNRICVFQSKKENLCFLQEIESVFFTGNRIEVMDVP